VATIMVEERFDLPIDLSQGSVRRPAAHRTNPSASPITSQAEGPSSWCEQRLTATLTILVSRLLPHKSAQVDQYAAQGE
jgi:hypothetical protein